MLNISISLDKIGYDDIIDVIFPLVFKNKVTLTASKGLAKSTLKKKTQDEKDAFVSSFINEHQEKILKLLQNEANSKGITLKISGITAKTD